MSQQEKSKYPHKQPFQLEGDQIKRSSKQGWWKNPKEKKSSDPSNPKDVS